MISASTPPGLLPTSSPPLSSWLLSFSEVAPSLSAGVVDEGLAASDVGAAVVVMVTLDPDTTEEEDVDEAEEALVCGGGGGVCAIIAPTLNKACCEMAPPCGCGMPCNIIGNMLSPFLASSADAPAAPAWTGKP